MDEVLEAISRIGDALLHEEELNAILGLIEVMRHGEAVAVGADISRQGEVFTLILSPCAIGMDAVVLATIDHNTAVDRIPMTSVLSTAVTVWMRAFGTVGRVSLERRHRGGRRVAEARVGLRRLRR